MNRSISSKKKKKTKTIISNSYEKEEPENHQPKNVLLGPALLTILMVCSLSSNPAVKKFNPGMICSQMP